MWYIWSIRRLVLVIVIGVMSYIGDDGVYVGVRLESLVKGYSWISSGRGVKRSGNRVSIVLDIDGVDIFDGIVVGDGVRDFLGFVVVYVGVYIRLIELWYC